MPNGASIGTACSIPSPFRSANAGYIFRYRQKERAVVGTVHDGSRDERSQAARGIVHRFRDRVFMEDGSNRTLSASDGAPPARSGADEPFEATARKDGADGRDEAKAERPARAAPSDAEGETPEAEAPEAEAPEAEAPRGRSQSRGDEKDRQPPSDHHHHRRDRASRPRHRGRRRVLSLFQPVRDDRRRLRRRRDRARRAATVRRARRRRGHRKRPCEGRRSPG